MDFIKRDQVLGGPLISNIINYLLLTPRPTENIQLIRDYFSIKSNYIQKIDQNLLLGLNSLHFTNHLFDFLHGGVGLGIEDSGLSAQIFHE